MNFETEIAKLKERVKGWAGCNCYAYVKYLRSKECKQIQEAGWTPIDIEPWNYNLFKHLPACPWYED